MSNLQSNTPPPSEHDRRNAVRRSIQLPAVAVQDGYEIPGTVWNISGHGAMMRLNSITSSAIHNAPLELAIQNVGSYPGTIMWRSPEHVGVAFTISESMSHLIENRLRDLVPEPEKKRRRPDFADTDDPSLSTDPPPISPKADVLFPPGLDLETLNLDDYLPQSLTDQPSGCSTDDTPSSQTPDARQTNYENRRKQDRFVLNAYGHAYQDAVEVPCRIVDISSGGARIALDGLSVRALKDAPLILDIPGFGQYPAVLRWRNRHEAGVSFQLSNLQAKKLAGQIFDRFKPAKRVRKDG